MLTYATPKGNPHLIPTGAPPTFAADGSDVSDWLQAGRSFRRAATQTALTALTGMADRDLALVDAIPGAWFVFNGSTAKWVMSGVPQFVDATARNAAIPAPVKGNYCYQISDDTVYRHNGTAWKPWTSDWAAYTATLTGFAVGSGGIAANVTQFRYEGGRVRVKYRFGFGTTGATFPSTPKMSLPVNSAALPHDYALYGMGSMFRVAATDQRIAYIVADQASVSAVRLTYQIYSGVGYAYPSPTAPWTWAAGDVMAGELAYDPA